MYVQVTSIEVIPRCNSIIWNLFGSGWCTIKTHDDITCAKVLSLHTHNICVHNISYKLSLIHLQKMAYLNAHNKKLHVILQRILCT